MKYPNDGRKICEDASYQKADVCFLYAGVFAWHYICEFHCKTIHCGTGDFQRLLSEAIRNCRNFSRRLYSLSFQNPYSAILVADWSVIYKAEKNFSFFFFGLDGLFQWNAPVNGCAEHGNQRKYPVYCRNPASFSVLYTCIYHSTLVLLYIPCESMESAKNNLCNTDDDARNDTRSLCGSGINETLSRNTVKKGNSSKK